MSFGKPSGLSSYPVCCGAVSQVRFYIHTTSRMIWYRLEVTGGYSIYSVSHTIGISGNIFSKATRHWISAFSALTIVTNLLSSGKCASAYTGCYILIPTQICSGLLAYRVWIIERNVTNSRTLKITTTSILRVVMDAAILYSMALICTLITLVCSNNGSLVVINMVIPPITYIRENTDLRSTSSRRSSPLLSIWWSFESQWVEKITIIFWLSVEGRPVKRIEETCSIILWSLCRYTYPILRTLTVPRYTEMGVRTDHRQARKCLWKGHLAPCNRTNVMTSYKNWMYFW